MRGSQVKRQRSLAHRAGYRGYGKEFRAWKRSYKRDGTQHSSPTRTGGVPVAGTHKAWNPRKDWKPGPMILVHPTRQGRRRGAGRQLACAHYLPKTKLDGLVTTLRERGELLA